MVYKIYGVLNTFATYFIFIVIIVNELLNFKVMESIMKHSLNNLYRAGNFKCVIEDELLSFIIYFNFNSLISENFFQILFSTFYN